MMKKAIKWTLFFILLGSCIASLLCSIIIPEQFNKFIEQVTLILNYPITIAGVSMTIGGIIAYVLVNFVIKNTKFGRRELTNMKADNDAVKNDVEQFKADTLNTVKNFRTEIDDFKKDTETKTTVMINQFENLQYEMLNALKTIPNKKVQAIVDEYKTKYEDTKQEFIQKVVNSDKYIEEKLTNMFKDFMLEVEEKLNEREETVDVKAEEE